jgi:hypothetical protein
MEINDVFNRMDEWRHLPDWQLERRADLFFSLYLKEVMEKRFNVTIKDTIIPEFPLLISPGISKKQTNRTNKVDYAVFSDEDNPRCYLIELKTDMKSIGKKQPKYLIEAGEKKISTIVTELKSVFEATEEKRKYLNLFESLHQVGLVKFKSQQNKIQKYSTWDQVFEDIEIPNNINNATIVYIQPRPDSGKVKKSKSFKTITFIEFANALSGHNDSFTDSFRHSLANWAGVKAGDSDYVKSCLGFYRNNISSDRI